MTDVTVLATAKTVSAISNAAEAVCTSTAHGFSNSDIVLVFSGWGRINYRSFKVKSVTTDTFVLEGCDTSNTTMYTPGSGAGTVQKATTWVDLDRTMNHSTSGGDPKPVPAPVQEQQPAPASKPVLLQCLGCERVGTQEQLSASTDCDCWLHTQLAPVQEPVAWASQTALDIAAEGGEGIIVGAEADCLIPLYTVPQPVPVQEPIGWSITCNGGHTGNFFPYRETAEATLIELNRKYPTDKRTIEPLFAAQPSKAVKLSDDEISTIAIDNPPNVHIYARAIEQAVLKANGIEP